MPTEPILSSNDNSPSSQEPTSAQNANQETESASQCCERCASLSNKAALGRLQDHPTDSVQDGYCGGFTFDIAEKQCSLGFDGLTYLPESVFTHEAGARIDACPKCGAGLDP